MSTNTESTPLISTTSKSYNVSVTLNHLKSPLGEDGEPNSEEIVSVIPKTAAGSAFLSRPVISKQKTKDSTSSSDPNSSIVNFFSNLFPQSPKKHKSSRARGNTKSTLQRTKIKPRTYNANTNTTNNNATIPSSVPRSASFSRLMVPPTKSPPEILMANERTFLAWLNSSIWLGGTSLIIIVLGDSNYLSAVYGMILLPVAVSFLAYAIIQYARRAAIIRSRDHGPYEDILGPTLLTTLFMVSTVVQLSVKLYSVIKY